MDANTATITARFNRDFDYTSDLGSDLWSFGAMAGEVPGDCEEYALTLLARLIGGKAQALDALRTGAALLHHVQIWNADRKVWQGHAVLEVTGIGCIDSSDRRWREGILSARYKCRFKFTYSFGDIERKLRGEPKKSKGGALAGALIIGLAVFGVLYLNGVIQ